MLNTLIIHTYHTYILYNRLRKYFVQDLRMNIRELRDWRELHISTFNISNFKWGQQRLHHLFSCLLPSLQHVNNDFCIFIILEICKRRSFLCQQCTIQRQNKKNIKKWYQVIQQTIWMCLHFDSTRIYLKVVPICCLILFLFYFICLVFFLYTSFDSAYIWNALACFARATMSWENKDSIQRRFFK